MEEPLCRVRTGGVHVSDREDEGPGPQGDSREHERRAVAALLW